MFDGFELREFRTREVRINGRVGGTGPPALLLHGFPQTHVMWHAVASDLADHFTVVATDLRGYGDSGVPEALPNHGSYSKRAMARDQVDVMDELGFNEFFVVGHDRGARVGHRMALDHPTRVAGLVLLDIVPTLTMFSEITKDTASAFYHWFFLSQPYDLPERLIGNDPDYYLSSRFDIPLEALHKEALSEYARCFSKKEVIHASCEDYRASASIDLIHDRSDLGTMVSCPVHVLWGAQSRLSTFPNIMEIWEGYARNLSGHSLRAGHFLAEESPKETCEELLRFSLQE